MLNSKKNRFILYFSAFVVIALILFAILRDNSKPISLQEVRLLISSKMVEKVVASNKILYIYSKEGEIYKIPRSQIKPEMLRNIKIEVSQASQIIIMLLLLVLSLGIGSLLYRWWQKRLHVKPQKSEAALDIPSESIHITPSHSNVTFSHIGGVGEVKEELEEIIDFLKNPKRYYNFGARMRRGV
jgi:ATP-dependent Zn protease